jgi:prevent-host-death family protein
MEVVMVTKTISAWEARRNLGKLMDEVAQQQQPIIIESHGEPKVGMVPVRMIERWEREREEFFAQWKAIAEASNIPDDEADSIIEEAIAEVRAEQRMKKAS